MLKRFFFCKDQKKKNGKKIYLFTNILENEHACVRAGACYAVLYRPHVVHSSLILEPHARHLNWNVNCILHKIEAIVPIFMKLDNLERPIQIHYIHTIKKC